MEQDIRVQQAMKLRFYRRLRDIKQTDVAEALGITQQAYSQLEKGQTYFSDEIVDSISKFFDITPAQFEEPQQNVTVASYNNRNYNSNNSIDEKLIDTLITFRDQNQELMEYNQRMVQELLAEKDARIKDLMSKATQ